MKEKKKVWIVSYFVLTIVFTLMLELHTSGFSDKQYQFSTALHMHAYDIQKNNTSQLIGFEPTHCSINKTPWLIGNFIEVTCLEKDKQGNQIEYRHKFSAIARHFDTYYERTENRQNKFFIKNFQEQK